MQIFPVKSRLKQILLATEKNTKKQFDTINGYMQGVSELTEFLLEQSEINAETRISLKSLDMILEDYLENVLKLNCPSDPDVDTSKLV